MKKGFVHNTSVESHITQFANRMRVDMIEMMKHAGANGAHIGGAFSAAEIFACLYSGVLNIEPMHIADTGRDRFILSKGHTAIALYSALYEAGFISHDELMSFEDNGGHFTTHTTRNREKGIELSSGSLGLGLSYGAGCALAGKLDGIDYDCFVLLGDGECNEGCVWEAAQAAAKFKLDNLIAIVDYNKQSLDGFTTDSMPIHSFEQAFQGFGWDTKTVDGHSVNEILSAFLGIERNGKPTVIIAETKKGKGVSFMENMTGWHHAYLSEQQYEAAMEELKQ